MGLEDRAQLLECFPGMHKTLSLTPSTSSTEYSGVFLKSQHPGGGDEKFRSSKTSSASYGAKDQLQKLRNRALSLTHKNFKKG